MRMTIVVLSLVALPSAAVAEQPVDNLKKFPCDPKFGHTVNEPDDEGNYLEITTGSDPTSSDELYVCFGEHRETLALPTYGDITRTERDWYDEDPSTGTRDAACLRLSDLPARESVSNVWSAWATGHTLDTANRTYQFALCGSDEDESVWEDTHRWLSPDAWDSMRLYTKTTQSVSIDRVRVVQNRVRILDDERADEGDVNYTLDLYHSRMLDLGWRIRNTKLRRLECLSDGVASGFCDVQLALDYQDGLPPVLETALLDLGHSGSAKYFNESEAWCSEFALYVIEQATNLSRTCANVPVPLAGDQDVSVGDMDTWFSGCGRKILKTNLKSTLQPGDYISTGYGGPGVGGGHSMLFIGWADQAKTKFWEISGNNECGREIDSTYGNYQNNMVCITKRDFGALLPNDFGGSVQN